MEYVINVPASGEFLTYENETAKVKKLICRFVDFMKSTDISEKYQKELSSTCFRDLLCQNINSIRKFMN
jgi:hypothetical protein